MAPPIPPPPPGIIVLWLAMCTGQAHVIPLFVKLGLAKLLDGRKLSVAELAEKTATKPDALARLLVFCRHIDLVRQQEDLYELTKMGQMLATPAFGDEAMARGEASYLAAWQNLEAVLRGETPAPPRGMGELRRARLAVNHSFALSEYLAGFKRSETYVDVGSGDSSVLAGVLNASARSEGIYVGREAERLRIKAELKAAGVAHRCDFLEPAASLPPGDAYIISHRLEELGDDGAAALLGRCRAAMRPNGRVLLIGPLVRNQYRDVIGDAALQDLELLLFTTSGTTRDEEQLRALCTRMNLVPKAFVHAHTAYVLEATAA